MIRSFAVIATALTLASPAFAAEAAAPTDDASSVSRQQLAQVSAAMQARQHLVRQGYVSVSELEQDPAGRWTGTAIKDGKTVIVAIKLPVTASAASTN